MLSVINRMEHVICKVDFLLNTNLEQIGMTAFKKPNIKNVRVSDLLRKMALKMMKSSIKV